MLESDPLKSTILVGRLGACWVGPRPALKATRHVARDVAFYVGTIQGRRIEDDPRGPPNIHITWGFDYKCANNNFNKRLELLTCCMSCWGHDGGGGEEIPVAAYVPGHHWLAGPLSQPPPQEGMRSRTESAEAKRSEAKQSEAKRTV